MENQNQNQQSSIAKLAYFFDRPALPIFLPKGPNSSVNISIPQNLYSDDFKPRVSAVSKISIAKQSAVITVDDLVVYPDISIPMMLDKREHFSVFIDFHMKCASILTNILLGAENIDKMMSLGVYIQQRVNPYMFIYALSVAILHREDTKSFLLPSHAVSFPALYMPGNIIKEAQLIGKVLPKGVKKRVTIPFDFTATDLEVENRLSYFREDIGINLHHWHWHLIYPATGSNAIVNKNRRGELFYYMHQQIMARYNVERFCNNLHRVKIFVNYRKPIPEGYFPKLNPIIASLPYGTRQSNTALSHVHRRNLYVGIEDLERWRERIFNAIHRGSVRIGDAESDLHRLTITDGIDILGNLIEASILSINRKYYGNLHNSGHVLIGFSHDPDNRFLESIGVMGSNTTAMRDPMFYRWHGEINRIFEEFKNTLSPYTVDDLSFKGIFIKEVNLRFTTTNASTDRITTFWEKDQIDLSRGLDFSVDDPIMAEFTHLQHELFEYHIKVENKTGTEKVGTVRIFLAPKFDERKYEFEFNDQRKFFIELDRFKTTLKNGENEIKRLSTESTVTIPFKQIFRSIDESTSADSTETNYCGCGWPDYMLLPKGTHGGFVCQLFVMITDHDQDKIDDTSSVTQCDGCAKAYTLCGLQNKMYPDKKPMGYPFDRLPRSDVTTLKDFLVEGNMHVREISIYHNDEVSNGETIGKNA